MRPDRDGADDDRGQSKESGISKMVSDSRLRDGATLPVAGDIIGGKYEIVRVLGSGAMGVVYEANHVRLRQRLAIKVLRSDVGDLEKLLARFENEAKASAQLRSIHAARVVDVDSLPNGLPYMVMEYLEGRGLDAELEAKGPMPVELAVDIVTQIATAMTEAHGLGILHRDLKPANIFVCHVGDRPVIKVLDFGISRVEGDPRLTGGGEWLGTPSYVAPETLRMTNSGDARSDIWSLGVILFELLTGRAPFEGGTVEVLSKVLLDPVPRPTEFRADLSHDLTRVVMCALQRDPALRFQSMRELAEALAPFGPSRSATTVVELIQRGRGRLGEILVAEGMLSQRDLDDALEVQRREGKLLGQVLLEMGFVGHADLLTVLTKQQGLASPPSPVVEKERIDREAPTLAPKKDVAPAKDEAFKKDEASKRDEATVPRATVPQVAAQPVPSQRAPSRRSWTMPAAVVVLALLLAVALGMAHRAGTQAPVTPPASDTPR
jgi:serine/threonine-protein kinase